jgi:hypothetical protein
MKMKPRHFAALLGTALCLLPTLVLVHGADADNDAKRFFHASHVTSAQGPEKAFTRPIVRVRTSWRGDSQTNKLSIVYTPRNGAVWAGPANAHCFFMGAQIVGVYSEPDGNLVFRRSSGGLVATESPRLDKTLERKLRKFLPPSPPRRGPERRARPPADSRHGEERRRQDRRAGSGPAIDAPLRAGGRRPGLRRARRRGSPMKRRRSIPERWDTEDGVRLQNREGCRPRRPMLLEQAEWPGN